MRRAGIDGGRGQLVLAAAGVLAIALLPLALAYLQLGAHPDVVATGETGTPVHDGVAVLERAVHEAGSDATGRPWAARDAAVAQVRSSLEPRFATLESSQVAQGIAYEVAYNQTTAQAWAASECPRGPRRQFGNCEAADGVVVQERAGETTVLAVAVDLTVTTREGVSAVTVVVPVVGGGR
ncbi:hypothetical protein [Haloarchaeobius sp. HME9146]|uniref:DUF7261 family protein n=1 Tax=Haloarchaeobius sp. HME9146 TaxID=2978732 RepID=UPI0021C0A64B|nr:hypothetical protein [Haloarchaeobius sp. HME9146]MCT9095693.1 hypothetical protein [Haloarchaeobius sp. HME9146]